MLKDFEATGGYIARNKHLLGDRKAFIPKSKGGCMNKKPLLKRLFPLRMVVIWVGIFALAYFSSMKIDGVVFLALIGLFLNWYTYKLESATFRSVNSQVLQDGNEQQLFKATPGSSDAYSETIYGKMGEIADTSID